MSLGITDALLEIELEAELELLKEDTTLQCIDNIEIGDIFSDFDDGDFELFESNTTETTNDENMSIWESYFETMTFQRQKYLSESQEIFEQMKETCADTLKVCDNNQTIENILCKEQIIECTIDIEPHIQSNPPREEDIITTNPCIPCHIAIESPKMHNINIPSPPPPPKCINITENATDYSAALQKLENELTEASKAHKEESQIDSTVKWSTLLQESKELFDEYIETTHKIKRDTQRLIINQCFVEWKMQWELSKRKKLRLRKLTQDMKNIVLKLMNKTVIRFQTKEYRHNAWVQLILKYKHTNIMNKIRSNSQWKLHVSDYIIFHYSQTYQSVLKHRNYFKINCLPLISETAQYYKLRRLSVTKISLWYKHQISKRHLTQILHAIHTLHIFKKHYIEKPLKENVLQSWKKYIKCRKSVIQRFTHQINRNKMAQTFCYLRNVTKLKICHRKILQFRKCKIERINYLILQIERKENAVSIIQSYFRMYYVRSIMNDTKNRLLSIHNLCSVPDIDIDQHTQLTQTDMCEFKELDENEYIFDQNIIDCDLRPLSISQSPKLQSKIISDSECSDGSETQSSSSDCESEPSSVSESETEREQKSETINLRKDDGWGFQNKECAKAWLQRKKKFRQTKSKRSAQSRLTRFNRTKQTSKGFGSTNRFAPKQKRKSKLKFVKFGCS